MVPKHPTPSTARTQTGSGSISLPSPGCFSPFPHGTVRYRSLGVACLGEWAPRLHTTLPVCGATQEQNRALAFTFTYPALTVSGAVFQTASVGNDRRCCNVAAQQSLLLLQPQQRNACLLDTLLVWACPISLATTLGTVILPRPTEMFQFSRFPPPCGGHTPRSAGLPHSEMVGSQPARGSPTLFAALPRPSSAPSA